ncbi:phosphotransferase [Micromonospora sp. NPDC050397]|uniref:phosphotransferase n=1 Tax=Micromonospora sp. NPDC050397 TaxID=3364279 RepID=UPI00384EE0EF
MSASPLPLVPYGATAVRPDWADLPAELRAAIAARLGARVSWATTAGGGFTNGFAGVLGTTAGDRVFVKAASLADQRHLSDWYARETAIVAALPPGLPVARPRWTLTTAGHFVICLDAIDGRTPALPWHPAELSATLDAYARVARALREPPEALVALGPPQLADLLRADLSWWREIVDGYEPVPAGVPASLRGRLPELASLEGLLPGYAHGTGLIHCDLRLDNVLIDRSGAAWICDWNWLCFGPAWFDLAGLLVTAYASGLDADRAFATHPATRDAPADGLDAALAALAGYWLVRATTEPAAESPHLRAHQRWSGETALAWLASRRGWR